MHTGKVSVLGGKTFKRRFYTKSTEKAVKNIWYK